MGACSCFPTFWSKRMESYDAEVLSFLDMGYCRWAFNPGNTFVDTSFSQLSISSTFSSGDSVIGITKGTPWLEWHSESMFEAIDGILKLVVLDGVLPRFDSLDSEHGVPTWSSKLYQLRVSVPWLLIAAKGPGLLLVVSHLIGRGVGYRGPRRSAGVAGGWHGDLIGSDSSWNAFLASRDSGVFPRPNGVNCACNRFFCLIADEGVLGWCKAPNDTAASWKIMDICAPWLGVGVARNSADIGRLFLLLFGVAPQKWFSGAIEAVIRFFEAQSTAMSCLTGDDAISFDKESPWCFSILCSAKNLRSLLNRGNILS